MTKLLEEAIAKICELPESEQDAAADAVLSVVHKAAPVPRLTEDQVAVVRQTRAEVRAGRLATDQEMTDLWNKHDI